MFACLLVAQYDTYNVAYTYFGDITAKKTDLPAKCDTLNTVLALNGNILCTIQNYRFVSNCRYCIVDRA